MKINVPQNGFQESAIFRGKINWHGVSSDELLEWYTLYIVYSDGERVWGGGEMKQKESKINGEKGKQERYCVQENKEKVCLNYTFKM